jgi:hypothetical protein
VAERPELWLTKHAWERCQEMGLTVEDVRAVVRDAPRTWTGTRGRDSRGNRVEWPSPRTTAQDDELAVVFNPESGAVITVLYALQEQWSRG